jgi:hypothetical protein
MGEYTTMAFGADLIKDVEIMPLDEFNKQTTIAIGKLMNLAIKTAKTFKGGNWHILSHSITIIGNRLLITVLLHR